MIKENKGITLLALTLTIIVLLILAGISINQGIDVISDTRENKQLEELAIIQHAILEKYTSYKLTGNEDVLAGKAMDYTSVTTIIKEINEELNLEEDDSISLKQEEYDSSDLDRSEFYYKLEPNQLKEINITEAKDTYIVNYKTGEVINFTQKKTNRGTPLYIYATE